MTDNSKRTLPDPVNKNGPGVSRIETPITGEQAPNSIQKASGNKDERGQDVQDVMRERIRRYAKLVQEQKDKMMDVDKDKLVDIIFRQNSLISQQSNQMIDLVNLVNELDSSAKMSEESQGSPVGNAEELQKNIDILKRRNELCQEADQMRQDSARMFSTSVRIQFVLFTLFILVLLWLLYHYMSFD